MTRGILVIILAAMTSGSVFWWARQNIALPACETLAQREGARLAGYEPIALGSANRSDPDGACRLVDGQGRTTTRSLSRQLSGRQNLTSIALRYDLVFLAAFVA